MSTKGKFGWAGRLAATGVLAGVLAGAMAIGVTGALAADGCETYPQQAAQQLKENKDKKCGFTGALWEPKSATKAYCESVDPDVWQKDLVDRTAMLKTCGS